jgi:hypothetical protein
MDRGVLWMVHCLLHRDNTMLRESFEQHGCMQYVAV